MNKKILCWNICFIIVIILSMFVILFCTAFDVLTDHDLVFSYGRTFLHPEHGRYLATFTNNILTERLPEIFNIHPNDFQIIVINPIKAVLIIISCLYIANAAFLFKNENILKPQTYNSAYIFTYILIFLLLFNHNFFFNSDRKYYSIFENTVFFEYPMSIFLYVVVLGICLYLFIKREKLNKANYIILLIASLLLGTSVDSVTLSVFAAWGIMALYFIILIIKAFIKKENLQNIKQNCLYIIPVYLSYATGLYLYYLHPPVEHEPNYGDYTFHEYIVNNIVPYIKTYINVFLGRNSTILIPIIIILIIGLFLCKKEDIKKLSLFVSVNILGFFIFFAAIFVIGYNSDGYWIVFDKWINIYRVITLFYLLAVIGFVCDKGKFEKYSDRIKIIICIIILAIFHKNLINDYWTNIENTRIKTKELRTVAYKAEKIATTVNTEDIIVPPEFEYYKDILWFDQIGFENCDYTIYINNVHPKIKKKSVVYSENALDNITFTEEELKELKFQNLLQEKMYRHKKHIVGCY